MTQAGRRGGPAGPLNGGRRAGGRTDGLIGKCSVERASGWAGGVLAGGWVSGRLKDERTYRVAFHVGAAKKNGCRSLLLTRQINQLRAPSVAGFAAGVRAVGRTGGSADCRADWPADGWTDGRQDSYIASGSSWSRRPGMLGHVSSGRGSQTPAEGFSPEPIDRLLNNLVGYVRS